ncbi:MAG: hypothetical protein ACRDNF_04415 [Streptosporangiaceae bacterium]
MTSLYAKKVNGGTYWYLREMARVGRKPKVVSERYVGSAAEIGALLERRDAAMVPGGPGISRSATSPQPGG